jgi:ferric-dicitrate binding protein FerR (iron transport regulator)
VKKNNEHSELNSIDQKSKAFFSGGDFRWKKDSAEVWANLESQIAVRPKGRLMLVNFTFARWIAAASILILISAGSFIRFYSQSVNAPVGQHAEAILPDNSLVKLNAASSITYHPYWWRINRNVELQGEAFFEVVKGSKFTVSSSKGTTQVLGTSFNVYAREKIYKVICVTGTVRVKSPLGNEVVLKPNSKAEIDAKGEIQVRTNIETYPEISWKKNIFIFTATPMLEVFYEIERQYGIALETRIDANALYSGNFTKEQNVEEILAYICPAMGLKFSKKAGGEYLISNNDE